MVEEKAEIQKHIEEEPADKLSGLQQAVELEDTAVVAEKEKVEAEVQ